MSKELARLLLWLIAIILYACFIVGISLISMIYGWGIKPQNWVIIIVSYLVIFFGQFLLGLIKKILE